MARALLPLLAPFVCMAAAAAPVLATDWKISGFASQRVEADTNFNLDPDGADDVTFGTITNFGVVLSAEDGRTRWTLAPGVRAAFYTGDGSDSNSVLPRFNGSVVRSGIRNTVTANLTVTPDTSNRSDFDQSGATQENATEINVSGRLGWSLQADPRNTIGLDGFVRVREFTETTDTLASTLAYGVDGSWRRALTPATGFSLLPGYERFTSDDDDQGDSDSFSLRFGVDHRINERLSFSATAGASLVNESASASRGSRSSTGFVGGVDMRYQLADTDVTLSLSQDVDQNSLGEVENRASFGLTIGHRINSRSGLSLGVQSGFENPIAGFGGDTSDRRSLSISPSYNLEINRDWSVQTGYSFRMEDDNDGVASSHLVFLELSRGLSFLP